MSHTSFAELNISEEMLAAVSSMGFYEATPVQAQAIPIIKSGRDLIAKSQTGTGKTIAFGLPVIETRLSQQFTAAYLSKDRSFVFAIPTSLSAHRAESWTTLNAVHSSLKTYALSSLTKPTKCSAWASRRKSRIF